MRTLLLLIMLVLTAVQGGCSGPGKTAPVSTSLNSTPGLITYLRDLPGVISVDSWANDYDTGLMITTAHYRIYTTMLEPLTLKRLPGFMEAAFENYQAQLPEPIEVNEKFDVYLFATRAQWDDYTKKFTGPMAELYLKIKAGAYYLNGQCVAYNVGMSRTFGVLGHEGWHQFNNLTFKYRLPSWLDEGIATLFETSIYENGAWKFQPDRNMGRLAALKMTVAKKQAIPISELLALNPGQVLADSDDAVMGFYAQSYALVRFLREDNYGYRLGSYQQMLVGAARGGWPLDARALAMAADRSMPLTVTWNSYAALSLFKHYICKDFATVEKPYQLFCNKATYRLRLGSK